MDGLEMELAPLIIQQVPGPQQRDIHAQRFGSVYRRDIAEPQVDTTQPTIYVQSRGITYNNVEYTQLLYSWFHAAPFSGPPKRIEAASMLTITIGQDGFPLVYQLSRVTSDNPVDRLVFVSRSFEQRAEEVFGKPLPGRHFAAERAVHDPSAVRVAGVVEDGPIPMGPYVYLSSNDHRVTDVLCRCSPSKMDSIVETAYYELQPHGVLPPQAAGLVERGLPSRRLKPARTSARAKASGSGELRWPY